jgi:hypothetical protein
MKLNSFIAVAAIAVMPVCAQAQQPAKAPPTAADAQRVVTIVSGDKAKTQAYCDLTKLGDQVQAAGQKDDGKLVEELSKKSDNLAAQVGPEFIALMDGLQAMDEKSPAVEAIDKELEGLDKLCAK